MLGFETDTAALFVDLAVFAGDGTVKEVGGVDLQAGFISIDSQRDTGQR